MKRSIYGADGATTGGKGGALVLVTDHSDESDMESNSEHKIEQHSGFVPAEDTRTLIRNADLNKVFNAVQSLIQLEMRSGGTLVS
ncbi:hypothetical protein L596_020757 [Steinernema carpocapsae]|uniref:Uncharacterized protein n=1 Tax=Steinernema carpocapsae TaxID=34508 RepID=A0A4U5MUN9_STECR|nr:hypothetical protein L596_020757 [Steinernema carpocapsae]